jgi:hypothetical protein
VYKFKQKERSTLFKKNKGCFTLLTVWWEDRRAAQR